jgi:hypothetical protein
MRNSAVSSTFGSVSMFRLIVACSGVSEHSWSSGRWAASIASAVERQLEVPPCGVCSVDAVSSLQIFPVTVLYTISQGSLLPSLVTNSCQLWILAFITGFMYLSRISRYRRFSCSLVVGSLVAWYLLLARWVRRFSLVSSGVHHGTDLLCHFFLGMAELQALTRAACSRSAILATSSTRWRVVSHVCRDQGASPGFCDRWRFRPRVLSTPSRAVLAPCSPGLCRCWIARGWFRRYKPALVCSRCGGRIVR